MGICRSIIAMTDVFDIKACKVVKKVVVGETLQVVGDREGSKDDKRDLSRLKFRSLRDGKEGWVTLKGNQGTVYMELSKSHYVVNRPVALHVGASAGSETVRQLEKGEAVEALEAPNEEKPATKMGLLARAVSDGTSGWVVFSGQGAPPVKPHTHK